MNSPVGWFLPAVAIAATGIAVWAGPTLVIAVPAAAVAVLAAGLLFADLWASDRARRAARAPTPLPPVEFRLRTAMRSGPLGREEVLLTLDRAERMGGATGLARRSTEEIDALVALSPAEFRAYLRTRLDDLERRL